MRCAYPSLSALLLAVALLACGACGGNVDARDEGGSPRTSAPLLVVDRESCTTGVTPSAYEATEASDPSDTLTVVELALVDECTGLGGHWVIAREIDSYRRFFIGAHGCRLWTTAPTARFGVVRHRQTAGLFSTPSDACVAFADEGDGVVRTDQSTSGVVAFQSRVDAESFAALRGWTKPAL